MTGLTLTDRRLLPKVRAVGNESVWRNGVSREDVEKLAFALGCIRVGVGLSKILAPRVMSNLIRRSRRPLLMRLRGFREVAAGVAFLRKTQPAGRRPRVGPLVGMAALLVGYAARRAARRRATVILAAVAGVTAAGIVFARLRAPRTSGSVR